MINTVSSGQWPVLKRWTKHSLPANLAGRDARRTMNDERNNSGYSSIPDDSRKEWENEQRANSCCYRSHSGLLNTVTSNKLQVTSKSVSTCQRINVSTLKPLHVIRPDQTWGETSPRYQSGWARYTLHVLEKHEA